MAKIGRKRCARRRTAGKTRGGGSRNKSTKRASLRTIALLFPPGSLQRVYLHGRWQKSRGRQPCLSLENLRDPRLAFEQADALVGEYIRSVLSQYGANNAWFWTNGSGEEYAQAIMKSVPPRDVF